MEANIATGTNYEQWIWIELIGFDNTQPDMGVGEYLGQIGFVPRAISLLITTPDFIHQHADINSTIELPPDACSYFGHPQNAERSRQVWTNQQVRQLVDELHAHGVKAFCATFSMYIDNAFHQEWLHDHQELFEKKRGGGSNPALLPLKRFKDGTYYEDFFIPKLGQVLTDYNFDGWHAADGWGPARLPLSESDYSDDMFDQFVQAKNIQVPEDILRWCDDCPECFTARAAWVWDTQRRAWIDFYTDRWAAFIQKKVDALHALGKEIVMNSAWTRDPFEAIYRFGIDYRKMVATGIDGIVTESAAGASDMEAEVGDRVFLYNYTASLLSIKAFAPQAKLIFLHGIKDTKEQWDLIHHAPTVLESETFSLTNIYLNEGDGSLKRCADGFLICLGDSIHEKEWQWLEKRWRLAFTKIPQQVLGATLLWSDEALSAEVDDFIANRRIISHRLLTYLMEQGAAIQAAVRLEDVEAASGNLLVLNSHNLNAGQLERVFEYKNGPIVMIGRKTAELPPADAEFAAGLPGDDLVCRAWNLDAAMKAEFEAVKVGKAGPEILDLNAIEEPLSFVRYLPMQEPSLDFIDGCARLISIASGPLRVVDNDGLVNVQGTRLENGHLRVLIRNRRLAYAMPKIEVGAAIKSLKVLSEFPCTQIFPDGSTFAVKVPGRGATVMEVELETAS